MKRNDWLEEYFANQWAFFGLLMIIAVIIFAGQVAGIIPSTANATRVPTLTPGSYVQRITIAPTLLSKTPTPLPSPTPLSVAILTISDLERDVDEKTEISYNVRGSEVYGEIGVADSLRFVHFSVRLLKKEGSTLVDVPVSWFNDVGYKAFKAKDVGPGTYQLVVAFDLIDQLGRTSVREKKTEFFSVP